MKTYKIKATDLALVRQAVNGNGYRYHRKEVALRVLDEPVGDITETYNYSLMGEDTSSDLMGKEDLDILKGQEVEVNQYSYIDLDLWLYYMDELATTISVYLIIVNNKSKIVIDRPTNADVIHHAVDVATNRKR